jgi:hypothetical protein
VNIDLTDSELDLIADLIGARLQNNARLLPTLVGQLYLGVVHTESHDLRALAARLFPIGSERRHRVELRAVAR